MGTISARQWTHACYAQLENENVMVVKEKIITIDEDTKEIVSMKNRLTHSDPSMINPKRRIYVTKPAFRNHKYKKETEEIKYTDMYVVDDRNLADELKRILDIPQWQRVKARKLYNSPYIYNADIGMQTLVRKAYNENQKHKITHLSFGALDIESSVLGDNRINVFTYIHEQKVYTAILDDFMYKGEGKNKKKAYIEDIRKAIVSYLGDMKDDTHFTLKYNDKTKNNVEVELEFELDMKIFEKELDLIIWIFSKIHKEETDFVGIWNIDYDIPQIMKRLEYYNVDPVKVFSHPSVPDSRKYLRYHKDKKKTHHIAEKWHWMHCTSMTQYLDMMLLYARIRKAKRKLSSYKLDAISNKELGFGKLTFGDSELSKVSMDHHYMQQNKFCEYVVYNIQDALLMILMERKNRDVVAMWNLTSNSSLADFSKQSVLLKDGYYKFALEHGRVYATTGEEMSGPYDDLMPKVGGAVLPANRCKDMGANCIVERPHFETQILPFASDLDYKAIYPSFKSGYGISKDTKIATVVKIQDVDYEDIEPLFGALATPHENAVWVGKKYFKLPDYQEMEKLATEHFIKSTA